MYRATIHKESEYMMDKKNDDDVSEDGYDPGDDASDDEAEEFILDVDRSEDD